MQTFEIINLNRSKYSFPSKEYKSIMLKNKDLDSNKLELNTCKYYLLNSKKYLQKNLKLSDNPLYSEYMTCLLKKDISEILSLRSKLEPFDSFITELDQLLNNLNFDVNKIKSKYIWNDIEIIFNTEKKKEDYINKTYKVEDKKYNNLLISHITRLENKIGAFKKLVRKDNTRINCLKKKLEIITKVIDGFLIFLKDNFVESEYLSSLIEETDGISKILNNQEVEVDFNVFEDVKDEILSSKAVKTKVEVREEVINFLKDFFISPSDQVDNIPFLPDFYDIAYDYIKYPSTDRNIRELLAKMDVK